MKKINSTLAKTSAKVTGCTFNILSRDHNLILDRVHLSKWGKSVKGSKMAALISNISNYILQAKGVTEKNQETLTL